ncbi:MAG: hypothetical protein ACO22K_04305 [Woeseiaceae bacterium]|jgi:D-alanyl-D-alanine dipeptidase
MTIDFFSRNWAIVIAGAFGLLIGLFVAYRAYNDSSRGQLRANVIRLKQRYRQLVKAHTAVQGATESLKRLQSRKDSVKPSRLQQAAEAVEDAAALQKIAEDQVLIAENHVRKVILAEFPPKRHEALRKKYLQRPRHDKGPFTF